MQPVTLRDVLAHWPEEDLKNLLHTLEVDTVEVSLDIVESHIKWLYYSKARSETERAVRNLGGYLKLALNQEATTFDNCDELKPLPRYDELISAVASQLNVYKADVSLDKQALYISQAVIAKALKRMSPAQREAFFEAYLQQAVTAKSLVDEAGLYGGGLAGPTTGAAAIVGAQASGFGVYMFSSTALGFLTHAVGMSLPFAAYTGLSSTIAVLIGPVGWLAVGGAYAWHFTKPKYKKLTTALLYIIQTNERLKLAEPVLTLEKEQLIHQ